MASSSRKFDKKTQTCLADDGIVDYKNVDEYEQLVGRITNELRDFAKEHVQAKAKGDTFKTDMPKNEIQEKSTETVHSVSVQTIPKRSLLEFMDYVNSTKEKLRKRAINRIRRYLCHYDLEKSSYERFLNYIKEEQKLSATTSSNTMKLHVDDYIKKLQHQIRNGYTSESDGGGDDDGSSDSSSSGSSHSIISTMTELAYNEMFLTRLHKYPPPALIRSKSFPFLASERSNWEVCKGFGRDVGDGESSSAAGDGSSEYDNSEDGSYFGLKRSCSMSDMHDFVDWEGESNFIEYNKICRTSSVPDLTKISLPFDPYEPHCSFSRSSSYESFSSTDASSYESCTDTDDDGDGGDSDNTDTTCSSSSNSSEN